MEKENHSYNFLYEHLYKLDNSDCLFILDFFHYDEENEEEFIKKHLITLKEFSYLNLKIKFLIFCKTHFIEDNHKNDFTNINKFILEILSQNENIFIETKLTNTTLITGYSIGKEKTNYIFTDQNTKNSNWLKIINSDKIKFSEFDFLKITLDYMLKGTNRNVQNKQQSKLSQLLDGANNKEVKNNIEIKNNKIIKENDYDIKNSQKFNQIIEQIRNYFLKSPPQNFKIIKNIISNFAEQNSIFFFKNYNIREEDLLFLLLSELLKREIIINRILSNLIKEKIITKIEEIETLLSFYINPVLDIEMEEVDEDNFIEEIKNENIQNKNNKSKRKKNDPINQFSISPDAEEQYSKLILNCLPICSYVKKIIIKILSNFGFTTIEKFPTNPVRYKNLIFSHVNNQELMKISKKILNLEYEKIVNILTEGIIIELMRNNLVVFISDKKIHYNIAEIEREKFRLTINDKNEKSNDLGII